MFYFQPSLGSSSPGKTITSFPIIVKRIFIHTNAISLSLKEFLLILAMLILTCQQRCCCLIMMMIKPSKMRRFQRVKLILAMRQKNLQRFDLILILNMFHLIFCLTSPVYGSAGRGEFSRPLKLLKPNQLCFFSSSTIVSHV